MRQAANHRDDILRWVATLSKRDKSIAADVPRLVGARHEFQQVLLNLLSNAMKYGAGNPIEVTVAGAGDAATIAVRDHGIGISKADLARIFGRFERAVSSRPYGGLGPGLLPVAAERRHGVGRAVAGAH